MTSKLVCNHLVRLEVCNVCETWKSWRMGRDSDGHPIWIWPSFFSSLNEGGLQPVMTVD